MTFAMPGAERARPIVGQFHDRAAVEGARYADTVNRVARSFIYDKVSAQELEKKLNAMKDPKTGDLSMAAFEADRGQLDTVLHFCRGVESHERANKIHGGPWQKRLVDHPATLGANPVKLENLTRDQVAQAFAAFDLGSDLIESEQRALAAYRAFLGSNADPVIPLSNNIKIKRVDVQALMNDIDVRITERIADPEVRRERLLELNRELLELIQEIPEEEVGKRFELQEIYLLRRLIQTADTGHLVSVNHGTPRQDLNIDEASVDLVITFAGRVDLQIKTYKARVSSHTLKQQREELAFREETLQGTETHLSVLQAEAVRDSFGKTMRQKENAPTSLRDKKTVFAPLLEKLDSDQSARLGILLGLTEERCEQERLEFERQQRALNEQIDRVLEQKRIIDAAERAAFEAERERLAKIHASEEQARLKSKQEREAADAEKTARKVAKKLTKEELRREAEAAKEALRKPRGWSVRPIETLCDAPTLRRLGFLPAKGDVSIDGLRAAKEVFWNVLPPDVFFEIFPDKKKFDTPSKERMGKVRALHNAYLAEKQREGTEARGESVE